MGYELPDFDDLKEMAENNPEQLEQLRMEMCDRLIQEAPEKYRRKLRGLQFRIDMERRRAKSPMAACIAISGMMHDSFDRLRLALNEATGVASSGYEAATGTDSSGQQDVSDAGKVVPCRRA
jgi:hypothetical protein